MNDYRAAERRMEHVLGPAQLMKKDHSSINEEEKKSSMKNIYQDLKDTNHRLYN
ncbi:hypothetical protein KIN20_012782 [Parelaphostrongylus tenuis]|uniref:Uncharacterized protein n=1 Tax=Parelaphostrongylus tenuis TaxID=148309 RepID=A0AAD5QQN2_PARTN|nr:hypothetical protein KIN20_012782 [Parelaphostrongylus tenuis]